MTGATIFFFLVPEINDRLTCLTANAGTQTHIVQVEIVWLRMAQNDDAEQIVFNANGRDNHRRRFESGRLQLVHISRGPLTRLLGLCELRVVTAAASSGVTIPGLPIAEAEELRDHLIAVAESRRAGL